MPEPTPSGVPPVYVRPGVFRVSRAQSHLFDARTGTIRFPAVRPGFERKVDRCYRTHFGGFPNSGVVYAASDAQVALAFTNRMMKSRSTPADTTAEDRFRAQQSLFVHTHTSLFTDIRVRAEELFARDGWVDGVQAAFDHVDDPHAKRLLRLQAWQELHESGEVHNRLWLRRVKYKMKRDEIAKAMKAARLIGDLGVGASLQGFWVTMLLKKSMEETPFIVNGITIQFCAKPKRAALVDVFEKLLDPPGRGYFVYFSDDACLSLRLNGRVYTFNLDISSCDASHTSALFQALIDSTPSCAIDEIRKLVEQCELPIAISSVEGIMVLILKAIEPRLYSGSTITTLINNLANICNAVAISEYSFLGVGLSGADVGRSVVAACENAGYVVSCAECTIPQDIQFLKHSPVFDTDGRLQPMLNLGTLLRSFGSCKGDLPGRRSDGDLELRAKFFQSGVLKGAYPYATFPLLEVFKGAWSPANTNQRLESEVAKRVATSFEYHVVDAASAPFKVSDEECFRRYRLAPVEIAEMKELAAAGFGKFCFCRAAAMILQTDYGLSQ